MPRKHEHYIDLAIEELRGDDRNVQSELVFYLCRGILIAGVDVGDIAVHLVELDSSEELIEPISTDDQRHAGGNCLILYLGYDHRKAA